MRSLMLHVNSFRSVVEESSTWPNGITPEKIKDPESAMPGGVVVFFCVEKMDSVRKLKKLYKDVTSFAKEVHTNNIMVSPFVHLSKKIASPKKAKSLYEEFKGWFLNEKKYTVFSSPFGYHKSLKLDIKGHPGAFRYREF